MSRERCKGRGPRRPLRLLAPVVAAVVVVVDQVTKTWALHLPSDMLSGGVPVPGRHVVGPVYLELTFNSGAAFGLGSGVTPIVETVVVLLVVALLVAGRRSSLRRSVGASAGLGLVIGGALGNLTDRLVRHHGGAVIDFINVAQVGDHEYWPVFNVADSCIVVGALLLAYRYSRTTGDRRAHPVGAGDAQQQRGSGA